jgi:hypothetical protein
MVVFRSILLIILVIVVILAVIGLGWQTFYAGIQKGADKVGITKLLKDTITPMLLVSLASII